MSSQPGQLRVSMLQDGARLHYAVPIALQRAGVLERMFTDWYCAPRSPERAMTRLLGLIKPDLSRKMGGRYAPELELRHIARNPLLALRALCDRRRFALSYEHFEHLARLTSQWVLSQDLGRSTLFHGFITNAHATLFEALRQRGLVTTGDQIIAPASVERRETAIQQERFPGWQNPGAVESLRVLEEMERQTWPHVRHITCASEFVRSCLLEQNIEGSRISVIPYPLDASRFQFIDRRGRGSPVTIGFVGAVNLRKGAPYFLQVARRFDPARARFVMLGPIQLEAGRLREYAGDVEVHGAVPRTEVKSWLNRFDVFLFPSTCEGSAGAVMEAMATGLPVVTSFNSGTVARHGVEGYIAPYDDIDTMTAAIEELVSNEDHRLEMGRAARQRVLGFNLDWYSGELASVLRGLVPG